MELTNCAIFIMVFFIHRMSTTLAALVLVIAFSVSGTGAFQCSSFANGCSTPFNMDVWYKKEFTPACNIHDVCYRCVSLSCLLFIFPVNLDNYLF